MVTTVIASRHAKAKTQGYADADLYPLSEEGIEKQNKVALALKNAGYIPTKIYSSPLLRARQTADIFSTLYNIPFEELPALGTEFDGERLCTFIPPPELNQTVLLVGHAPTLAHWINQLIGDEQLPGLSTSSAAILTIDPNQTKLVEVIHG
ncbi:MAG: histidine phosphatase family protein [Waddliaceae bacterium]